MLSHLPEDFFDDLYAELVCTLKCLILLRVFSLFLRPLDFLK